MEQLSIRLKEGKSAYFASDFHLGTPNLKASQERERKIVSWLDSIKEDAQVVFLVGDIFDFWFEYKYTIPKGFIRFQGKLAELVDSGIEIYFFTGNHDMWMFDYFKSELGIRIFRNDILLTLDEKRVYLGHGDGLGPGDHTYKFLKKFFASPICQWMFRWLHPNVGFWIATSWSKESRASNAVNDAKYFGENEWLLQYAKSIHGKIKADFYVFGHRHYVMELPVEGSSLLINLGDWLHNFTFGVFNDGKLSISIYKNPAVK